MTKGRHEFSALPDHGETVRREATSGTRHRARGCLRVRPAHCSNFSGKKFVRGAPVPILKSQKFGNGMHAHSDFTGKRYRWVVRSWRRLTADGFAVPSHARLSHGLADAFWTA